MKLLLSKPNEALRLLYEQSFPPEERRDWCALPVDTPAFKLWAIVDDDIDEEPVEVGLVTVWEFDGFSYVEHFAVQPGLRGAGVGSWVLSQLREQYVASVRLYSARVDKCKALTGPLGVRVYPVARNTRRILYDGKPFSGYFVEQRAFSDVRPSNNSNYGFRHCRLSFHQVFFP